MHMCGYCTFNVSIFGGVQDDGALIDVVMAQQDEFAFNGMGMSCVR